MLCLWFSFSFPIRPFLGEATGSAVRVCFFSPFAYWCRRDCLLGKATLMNLYVDMSIYGVCLFVVDALVVDLIGSTTTIIEPLFSERLHIGSDLS